MTPAEIQTTFDRVMRDDQKINVVTTAYLGMMNPARPDKQIAILCGMDSNGDEFAVLVGDKGRSGPSLLKTGPSSEIKKFKANAFFSMKNAGFRPENIVSTPDVFYSARALWNEFFSKHHSNSEVAKIAFLKVIGIDTGSSFADITSTTPGKAPPSKAVDANPYANNPLWGLL
jgi:hypothetical protein